ncbi:MAG: rod shape-determining protein MreC [Candidatus Limimorpha sp.]
MYNIFLFIKKYNAVILFVILETLCFIMMTYSLPFHNRKMVNACNELTGGMDELLSNWNDYLNLKRENERLASHNAQLLHLIGNAPDSVQLFRDNGDFSFLHAHVIDNNIYATNNYMVIDKGRLDGVCPDMGVISDNGIVGIVVNASNHYASVMSLLNSYSSISCRFLANQHIATLAWDNNDYRYGVLKDIPSHLIINKGDTVVTSGFSNTFPADIMVGTIEDYYKYDNDVFSLAKIKFATNFSTIRHVYVVKNNNINEIDSLCITH